MDENARAIVKDGMPSKVMTQDFSYQLNPTEFDDRSFYISYSFAAKNRIAETRRIK
jgi:hypothetical protein